MGYPVLVCLDVDEMGGSLKMDHMIWLHDASRVDRAIRDLSIPYPNSTINVYSLTEMQKLKTNPTYQRYKVSSSGEIVPV